MQWMTLLGILGLVATVVLGVPSVVYYFRSRRYPGQVTLVEELCLGLFDTIVKNLAGLAVSFKDQPVSEGLVLLKGAFLNTGSKDITREMVAEPISMSLPEGFKWVAAELVSESPKVECGVKIKPQSLEFQTGLLRRGEFVRFEALAEVPISGLNGADHRDIGEELRGQVVVKHRIADTAEVVRRRLPIISRRHWLWHFADGAVLSAFVVTVVTIRLLTGWPSEVRFRVPSESGPIGVTADYQLDGTVRLKGAESPDFSMTMPAQDFFKMQGLEPYVVPAIQKSSVFLFLGIVLLVYLPKGLYACIKDKKARQLRALLGIGQAVEAKGKGG